MSEKFNYVITIKSNEAKIIQTISNILVVIALAIFLYLAVDYIQVERLKTFAIFLFVVCGIIAVIWLYVMLNKYKPSFRYAFFLAGISLFFYFPHPVLKFVLGGLYILLGLIESSVRKPKEIAVDNSGILINGLPGKFILWNKLKNVVIKDQLITIDFKNNKLYQKEIDGFITPEIQNEFNAFVRQRIQQSNDAG